MNDAAARSHNSASKAEDELRETRLQLDVLNSKINSFDAQTAGLHVSDSDCQTNICSRILIIDFTFANRPVFVT